MRLPLTKSDRDKIKASVERAEKSTSGQIVPLIVPSSYDYGWVHWFWAVVGSVVASAVLWAMNHFSWTIDTRFALIGEFVGMILGFLVGCCPPIKRLTAPKKVVGHAVHRQCMADFLGAGLVNTRHRTGVLIYVSLLERRAEILADKGIHEKTPKGYWAEQLKKLTEGIQQERGVDTLCEVIEVIGKKLSEHFPNHAGEENELSDEVRVGHRDIPTED